MPKHRKPSRSLACYKCGSESVRVTESQQMKQADGRPRLHADVRCRKCGHQWWSHHADALRRSRAEDDKSAAHRDAPSSSSPDAMTAADALVAECSDTPLGMMPA